MDMVDPTPTDLEMLADKLNDKLLPRIPAQGITDMEARIQLLNEQKATLHNHFDSPDATRRLNEIKLQLHVAESRLTEYRIQLKGLN